MSADNVADDTGQTADIVITDQQLYDHATSKDPAPATVKPDEAVTTAEKPPQPQPQEPATDGRQRDAQGRFAPKAEEPTTQQPPPHPQSPQAQQQRQPEDHRVPLTELLSTRERAQKAEAELAQMRQAYAQWQWQQQQVAAQQQAELQRQQQPQEQRTIFDDTEGYLNERVMNPLRQEGQMYMMQVKDGMSREMANMQWGEQRVEAALADMAKVRHTPKGDLAFRQIMASGHPYGQLMKWQAEMRAHQAIGPDPQAWLNKRYEAWENDPRVQARIVAKIREQQQKGNGNRPPNVSLPPSLSSAASSAPRYDDQGDMSDASLYNFATRK